MMLAKSTTRAVRLTICAAAAAVCVAAQPAFAEGQKFQFDISAKRLDKALVEASSRAGRPIIIPSTGVKQHMSPPLKGSYSLNDALAVLLQATDLKPTTSPTGVIMVRHVQAAPPPRPIIPVAYSVQSPEPAPARGAPPAISPISEVAEVLVTARRREESLLEVPLAISAYSSAELEKAGVTNLEGLAAATPGLAFQSLGGTYQAPVIRGLAQVDQTSPIGNVGVFLDGVYINNRSGQEFGFIDLERIEVVKGPQSALYGRNTFSGAINYVSKRPALGKIDGFITGEVGNYERRSLQGSLSLPLGDTAAVRVFGGRGAFDGTIDNSRDGGYLGGYDDKSTYGVSFLWKPSDKASFRAFYTRSDVDNDQAPFAILPTDRNNCGSRAVGPFGPRFTLLCGQLPYPDSVNLLSSPAHGLRGFSSLGYVTADYDFGFATLSGTYGFTKATFSQLNDQNSDPTAINRPLFPGSPLAQQSFLEAVGRGSEETSFDIRLTSAQDRPITWSVGAYVYDSQIENDLNLFNAAVGNLAVRTLLFGRGGEYKTDGRAIYGSLGWDITDRINLEAEARYSVEQLDFRVPQTPLIRGSQEYKYTSPRLTATYKVDERTNLYASVARGYKIGGFNSNAFGLPQFKFRPETNWSYELGLKTVRMDGRLAVDTSLYFIDWNNIQVQSNIPASTIGVVTNNKGATSYGWEFNSVYNFTENFWVRASFTVLRPTYKDGTRDGEVFAACGELPGSTVIVKGCSSDVGGKQLARTSDKQFALAADWTIPKLMFGMDGYVRADYSWQAGKHSFSLGNDNQGDIQLVNGRIGLRSDHIELALWGNNILDEEYLSRATVGNSPPDGAPLTGVQQTRLYPGEKRTVGIRATYRY